MHTVFRTQLNNHLISMGDNFESEKQARCSLEERISEVEKCKAVLEHDLKDTINTNNQMKADLSKKEVAINNVSITYDQFCNSCNVM